MMKAFTFGLIAALSTAVTVSPLRAESSPARVAAHYDFFVGGFRIAEVSLSAMADKAGYRARSSAVTRGVLDMLLRGRSNSEVSGRLGRYGQLVPVDFSTFYKSRGGEQKINIAYDGADPTKVVLDPKTPDVENTATMEDRRGSLDPLSAAVAALIPSRATDLCNRTIPIYDGKRRFDILFLPPDPKRFDDGLPAPDWHKPLTRCLGIYERISGFEEPATRGQQYFPFDIWFEDSGNGVFRAVRVAGSTKLGFAVGNLRVAK